MFSQAPNIVLLEYQHDLADCSWLRQKHPSALLLGERLLIAASAQLRASKRWVNSRDSTRSISDKKLTDAFRELMALEKMLLDEKDSVT